MKSWRLVLMVVGFVIAGCSSAPLHEFLAEVGDTDSQVATAGDAQAEVAGESLTATSTATETETARATGSARATSSGSSCVTSEMPNMDRLAVSAEGGLNARQAPGNGSIITTLSNGTIVTTSDDPLACGVIEDGSVWYLITAPPLGGPAWVHSGFLQPVAGAITAPDTANVTAPAN